MRVGKRSKGCSTGTVAGAAVDCVALAFAPGVRVADIDESGAWLPSPGTLKVKLNVPAILVS
jgi:hypothetical protein